MRIQEHVPLAPLTTLRVGGTARFFIEAHTETEVEEAISFARERGSPLIALGEGSNVLVPDDGVDGVVLKVALRTIAFEDDDEYLTAVVDAGARWDTVVDAVGTHGIFGIENLAGIPGSVGGAAVQNIGAYGAELAATFAYADVIDTTTGAHARIPRDAAAFAYRMSLFKERPEFLITRVALRLTKRARPDLSYADVARTREAGTPLTTPAEIACAIRAIRAEKFPRASHEGTAGSFFKNPVISSEHAEELIRRFPGMPLFPQQQGGMKVPLAWLLDHVLALKGCAEGPVRLFEEQPLVIVAREGATAAHIDAFARAIAARVRDTVGITIEREVETLGERFFS